jgi:TRAP-type mannitol/chloroaromatic compound transport system substrate-binding protein
MSQVTRRKFIKAAGAGGLGAAAATVAAPAIAQSSPEIKWRLTASWPKSLDTLYGNPEYLSKRVAEITDNKFQIQCFAAGEIVPGLQVLDAVQAGTVEAGHTALYYYFGKDPTFTFGTDLPFGINSRMKNAWYMHGGGQQLMDEFIRTKYNCTGFISGSTNCQMGGWFRKEIKSMEDMKGLKFRVGGFAGLILERLGVVPQQIAGGDIYPALEKGTIDACEWVGPYDDEKLGFNKVAKYYYYPGWWEGASVGSLYINNKAWDSLPKAYQAMIEAAAGRVTSWMVPKYDAGNPAALRRLVAAGTELRPFPRSVLEPCFLEAYKYYDELSAKDPKFKKIYDNLKAFRADENLWFRVAENTFDNFNFSMSAQGR